MSTLLTLAGHERRLLAVLGFVALAALASLLFFMPRGQASPYNAARVLERPLAKDAYEPVATYPKPYVPLEGEYQAVRDTARAAGPNGKVSTAVMKALATESPVSVIVTLASGPAPSPDSASVDLAALAHSIRASAARVMAAVPPGEFEVSVQYQDVPALVGKATTAGVAALLARPDVVSVTLNREIHASLAEAVPLIRADDVHTVLGRTGAGVVVAVLDTGIDTDHPFLSDDLNYQKCFLTSGTCPGGGTTGPSAEDGNGHGTHVSGIITSAGPPVGVAPDALIDAFKILDDSGAGSFSDVLAAYDEIINIHPEVKVINMSLGDDGSYPPGGCEGFIPAFTTAVATTRALGITTFAASGNSGSKGGIGYPACLSDIVSVGAVYDANLGSKNWLPACIDTSTMADQVACFSQSNPSLDLLAPGSLITSTVPGGGLGEKSGTSMASPMAAGVAALLLESEPLLTPLAVETRLKETGVPVTDPGNGVTTCRVDAYEAVINDGGAICSSPVVPPLACPFGGNDGFETGSINSKDIPCWTVVDQAGGFSGGWCNQSGAKPPHGACTGGYVTVSASPQGRQAAMTNESGAGSHVLYRCGVLDSGLVSFKIYIKNEFDHFYSPASLNFHDGPNQQFRADLVTPAGIAANPFTLAPGEVLLNIYETQPGDPQVSGYTTLTAGVGAYVGQNVCLRFAEVDTEFFFHAGVDDVQFGTAPKPTPTPCPPGGCPTATRTPTSTITATRTPTSAPPTTTPTSTPTPSTSTPTRTATPAATPIGCDEPPWDWDLVNCFASFDLWHHETSASISGMSGGMLAFNEGCTGPGVTGCTYATGATTGLATSPAFAASSGATLTFKTARSTENACGSFDRTFVLYSTNGGSSFAPLDLLSSGSIIGGGQILAAGGEICGESLTAQTVTVLLPAGATNIAFDFDTGDAASNNFPGQFIDDVDLTPCPAEGCPTATPTNTPSPTLTPTPCFAPTNDDFANSAGIGAVPYTVSQSTLCATTQAGEPQPCAGIGSSVWYSYTPPVTQTLQAHTSGSNYDTALAVYTGAGLGTLSPVACDDDSGPGLTSLITFVATGGTPYHFQVGGFSGDAGDLVFNLASCPSEGCPTPTRTPTLPPISTSTPTPCPPEGCPTSTPTATPCLPGDCPDFSIAVDIDGDNVDDCATRAGSSTKCNVPRGTRFTLKVYLDSLPEGARKYVGFDVFLTYSGVSSKDNASSSAWPDCDLSGSGHRDGVVVFGCATLHHFSTYTGLIGTNDFNCTPLVTSKSTVTMVHGQSFTDFVEGPYLVHTEGEGTTETLIINCVEPPTPTSTSTPTPTPTPTPTHPALGGVAEYPPGLAGTSVMTITMPLAAAIATLALAGATWCARRRWL